MPGAYQVGWEGSGMEREGMIRSKVVFKEGDGVVRDRALGAGNGKC